MFGFNYGALRQLDYQQDPLREIQTKLPGLLQDARSGQCKRQDYCKTIFKWTAETSDAKTREQIRDVLVKNREAMELLVTSLPCSLPKLTDPEVDPFAASLDLQGALAATYYMTQALGNLLCPRMSDAFSFGIQMPRYVTLREYGFDKILTSGLVNLKKALWLVPLPKEVPAVKGWLPKLEQAVDLIAQVKLKARIAEEVEHYLPPELANIVVQYYVSPGPMP